MKIQSSNIIMSSSHSYSSFSYAESTTIEGRASEDLEGVILSLSEQTESGNFKEAMEVYEKQKEEAVKRNQEELRKSLSEQLKANNDKSNVKFEMSDEFKMKLEMIRRLFNMLSKGEKFDQLPIKSMNEGKSISIKHKEGAMVSVSTGASAFSGQTGAGTLWTKVTATSGFFSEQESTTFDSTGVVKTADGRSIDFSVSVSMSRAYTESINVLESTNYILTDPLVINMDTNITSLSDQKFYFDLNTDGEEEEISFVGGGSGFLALDKNNDGVINDGSELFGTASGDGFKDLAAYDEDGNNWIDENDSIYNKLKVWTKDEEGKDILLDLKEADVGAIYLSNADTEFSFKDESNQLNGVLRKTGIYLKESTGEASTVSHVDLAI